MKMLKNDWAIILKDWKIIPIWRFLLSELIDILSNKDSYIYVKTELWWYIIPKREINYLSEDLHTYHWKDADTSE